MARSYSHLWEKYISEENRKLAIKKATRGKTNRRSVRRRLNNPHFEEEIDYYAKHYENKPHTPKVIYDGIQRKKRTIIIPSFDELVIQHMVINVLESIFSKGMYQHSYGSIPKRGPHKGKKTIVKWLKRDYKNCKYCAKFDIRKYFENIRHDVLIRKLRKIIHDVRFLNVLIKIIEVIPVGLPLGFYTSQWLANWYLQELDHFIKEKIRIRHYIRYMDDIILFSKWKRNLHYARITIGIFISGLGLELKHNWQIFRFEDNGKYRFLDFMGFRFYRNRVTIRKSILLKATRKARRLYKESKIRIYSARQMLSYLGYFKHTDTYNIYLERIKPFINFQYLKRRISKYDKRRNRRANYGMVQCSELCTA